MQENLRISSLKKVCETIHGTIPDMDDTIFETSDTIPDTNVQERMLLSLIMQDPAKKQKEYANTMEVSVSTIKRMFARLQETGILTREGTNRKGRWIITDKKR